MILQSAMARIRRKGGLIEILLFFSHEVFIKTFRQIVKLFERTNIYSRKLYKREKQATACKTVLHNVLSILREGAFRLCAEPPSGFMACSHMRHTEAKKVGSLAGAYLP